ncbi:hypothetical protein BJX68DRAFT_227570 [Aspergillus pseudodeflectus]|uniref:Ankyrin repeat-containing domain protein n=1 Tax=Aspergillus pseudodeflectus TaxID=176178 RepID=A0ABR4L378_9EURO
MHSMRVPIEVLRLILRHMVDALPVRELLRARLVSYVFATELDPLIQYSPHFEENDLVYTRWSEFPYKRTFVQSKLDHHDTEPCFFSGVVHDLLSHHSVATLSQKEKDGLISALIDTVMWSSIRPKDLFSENPEPGFKSLHSMKRASFITQDWDSRRYMAYESLESTIAIARATSAIVRGDAAELAHLLELGRGVDSLTRHSYRLEVRALDVAAKVGSKCIICVLLDHKCPLEMIMSGGVTNAVRFAASHNNLAAIRCWLEKPSYEFTYDGRIHTSTWKEAWRALYSTIHKVDSLEALAPAYDGPDAFPNILCHAVRCGELETVRWCLARDDARVFNSKPRRKGPLWLAIQDCWEKTTRYTILKLLLEYGFDPNERRAGVHNWKTLLHAAIKEQAVESARLLVQHGADVNANAHGRHPLPRGQYKGKNRSPLAVALEQSPAIARMLLDNGARRRWWWKDEEYVFGEDQNVIGRIQGVFRDLGFDEQEVMYEKLEYYVVVNQ